MHALVGLSILLRVVAGLFPLAIPLSYNVDALIDNLLPMSETMFNLLIPVVGLIAGVSLGIGLVGKILSAIRSAF